MREQGKQRVFLSLKEKLNEFTRERGKSGQVH